MVQPALSQSVLAITGNKTSELIPTATRTDNVSGFVAKCLRSLTLQNIEKCHKCSMAEDRISGLSLTKQFKHTAKTHADNLHRPHTESMSQTTAHLLVRRP